MKNKKVATLILFGLAIILTSCAPEGYTNKEYGFFSGIIHGLVFIFALLAKLFGFDYGLYATNNSGFFYWVGFIIGLGGLGGGASRSR